MSAPLSLFYKISFKKYLVSFFIPHLENFFYTTHLENFNKVYMLEMNFHTRAIPYLPKFLMRYDIHVHLGSIN